jgi:hypothetical protein
MLSLLRTHLGECVEHGYRLVQLIGLERLTLALLPKQLCQARKYMSRSEPVERCIRRLAYLKSLGEVSCVEGVTDVQRTQQREDWGCIIKRGIQVRFSWRLFIVGERVSTYSGTRGQA